MKKAIAKFTKKYESTDLFWSKGTAGKAYGEELSEWLIENRKLVENLYADLDKETAKG